MRRFIGYVLMLTLFGFLIGCESELNKIKVLENQGDWPKAQEALQKAIEKKPNNPMLRNELGFVYRKRGYFDLALTEYNKAIKLDPYYIEAFYNRGTLYFTMQNVVSAQKDFQKVISLDKKFPQAFNNLGLIYQLYLNKPDEALTNFKKAMEIDPANPVYHKNLSRLYADMGKTSLAAEEAKRAKMLQGNQSGG